MLARLGEELGKSGALGRRCAAQEVNEHQRPLALPDVPVELLAVAPVVAGEIQEIVLDLERGAEEETEADETIEVVVVARADERSDSAGVDRRVPTGLLQHHLQVVGL